MFLLTAISILLVVGIFSASAQISTIATQNQDTLEFVSDEGNDLQNNDWLQTEEKFITF